MQLSLSSSFWRGLSSIFFALFNYSLLFFKFEPPPPLDRPMRGTLFTYNCRSSGSIIRYGDVNSIVGKQSFNMILTLGYIHVSYIKVLQTIKRNGNNIICCSQSFGSKTLKKKPLDYSDSDGFQRTLVYILLRQFMIHVYVEPSDPRIYSEKCAKKINNNSWKKLWLG